MNIHLSRTRWVAGAAALALAVTGAFLWKRAPQPPDTLPTEPAREIPVTDDKAPAAPDPAPPATPIYTRPEAETRAIIREISRLELPEGTARFRANSFTIPADRVRAFYEAFLASFGKEGFRRYRGQTVHDIALPNGRSIPADQDGNAAIDAASGRMVQFSAEGFSYDIFIDLADGDVKLNRYSWDRD